MRMNRLITVVLDHPEQAGIGIDESTAILVENGRVATVYGGYQVIALRHPHCPTPYTSKSNAAPRAIRIYRWAAVNRI
jgi:cyanophycinase